jgi:hypothetical protein
MSNETGLFVPLIVKFAAVNGFSSRSVKIGEIATLQTHNFLGVRANRQKTHNK